MNIGKIGNSFFNNLGSISKKITSNPITKGKLNAANKGLEALGAQNKCTVVQNEAAKNAILEKINFLKNNFTSTQQEFILENGEKAVFEFFENSQAGSNKGGYAINKKTNELFYAKFSESYNYKTSQSETEVLASKIYKLMGIEVPEMELIKTSNSNEIGLISKYIPNLSPVTKPLHATTKGFGTDVFLANWDATMPNNLLSNNNKLYRIDLGGSLQYRAQGANKEFGMVPNELTTMLDFEINPISAHLYSAMTKDELLDSIKKVTQIDNKQLAQVCKKYGGKDANETFRTLIKRKEFFIYAQNIIENTPKNNLTMLEYLTKVKNKILTTPINELRLNQNINAQNETLAKIPSGISKIKSDMTAQRNALFQKEPIAQDILIGIKDSYGSINHGIRNKFFINEQAVKRMDDIVSSCTIPQDTTLYRCATPYDFGGEFRSIKTSEFLDNFYKKNEYFTIPIFPNTTLDENIAKNFIYPSQNSKSIFYKINVPKGTKGVYMENIKNSSICTEKNEEEIILPKNLIYKFKNRTPYFEYDLLELEVVNNPHPKAVIHNFEQELEAICNNGELDKYFPNKKF